MAVDEAEAKDRADAHKHGRRSIWRHRGWRVATGLNVCISIALALIAFGMVNYIGWRYYARWNMGQSEYYKLSEKTQGLIRHLNNDVQITAFVQKSFWMYDDIRALLAEYEYAARGLDEPRIGIRFVDPDRELVAARELATKYDIHGANVVLFECQGRRKIVEAKSIADMEYTLKDEGALDKRMVGFRAEEAFSSAILSVSQSASPVVYFLRGHGERDTQDFSEQFGYSAIGRALVRDNIDIRPLILAERGGVPDDCATLVIAGPEQRLPSAEVEMIAGYMSRNGRLLVLLDPAVRTGLEKLLEDWGIRLATDVVFGISLTGRELVVTDYGDHPITKGFGRTVTLFYSPRSVEARDQGDDRNGTADRPRVTSVAMTTTEGWAEADLKQHPPKFDTGLDRRGPISIAVAVERGPASTIRTGLKASRLVVVGDSFFVANGALSKGADGNKEFLLRSVNWLMERETLLAIGPKKPGVWVLNLDVRSRRLAYALIVGAVPGMVALLGICVWARRRRK